MGDDAVCAPPPPFTGSDEETGLVHAADEELEADDGVDDDDEEDEEGDVQQRHHGLHDGVEDDVETCGEKRRKEGLTRVRAPPKTMIFPPKNCDIPPPKTDLTGDAGDEAEGPEDAEGAQGFDVETPRFAAHVVGFAGFVGRLFQDDAEEPEGGGKILRKEGGWGVGGHLRVPLPLLQGQFLTPR